MQNTASDQLLEVMVDCVEPIRSQVEFLIEDLVGPCIQVARTIRSTSKLTYESLQQYQLQ